MPPLRKHRPFSISRSRNAPRSVGILVTPDAELPLAQRDLFTSRIRFIGRGCYMQIVMSHIIYRDRLIVFYLSAQQRLKIGGVMSGFLLGAALFQMVVALRQICGVGYVLGRR